MKFYELTYLTPKNLSPEEKKGLLEKVVSFLPSEPAAKTENLNYVFLEFQAEPEKIEEIEKGLNSESRITKHLILRKEVSRAKLKPARKAKTKVLGLKPPAPEPKVELGEIDKKLKEIFKE